MKIASWEKSSWGGLLHIWLTGQSKADISIPCETYKQAKIISKTYGIEKVSKQCQ